MGRFEPLPTDPYEHPPGERRFGAICAACRGDTRLGTRFCTNCSALREDAERGHTVRYAASKWMRLFARLADVLLIAAIGMTVFLLLDAAGAIDIDLSDWSNQELNDLNVSTLIATGIWFLWFALVAPRGQTPGKQLLRMRIIMADGSDAPTSLNWMREGLFQFFAVVPSLVAEPIMSPAEWLAAIVSLAPFVMLLDAAFIFAGSDKQTVHDRIFRTLVVRIQRVPQHSAELRAL